MAVEGGTVGELLSKHFEEPDERVSQSRLSGQIVLLGDTYVARYVYQPGWRWSQDVRPLVGTASCQFHHQGIVVSGYLRVATDEGAQRTLGPGEAFDIPPGHDAWVLGDEPCVSIEFRGARGWARSSVDGERVLATLLVTDIVGSTAMATRIGDLAWKELLARHGERLRLELDRFRGYEIDTKGDGFLAAFDGAARAVRCAAAIARAVRKDGLEVRAGVHSGEVERNADGLRGVAVHAAARVAAQAQAGEVLISASTAALLEGSGLSFDHAGEHELKGLPGKRVLYRLVGEGGASAA